ncbi:hypothetical protein FKR81_37645 [Lentzea tibetensis]|uniref:Uncharacterized protein n=1 Tax=Lentzea tibetensis TaxID=2591470 RepID=A0A563EHN8_9PSEU|nr:hypothetical protein [Lentzea tibetensis]TWP45948.1 hypothetical protein FKR81_37645 [Lentzea tibetensis]
MPELNQKYDWVKHLDVVLTFAVVSGRSVDDAVRTYGGNPAEPQLMTTVEAEDAALDDEGHAYVQVFAHQGAVVALENNSWSGTIPEIARRASADGGHFFSVHWNVNGAFQVVEADGGKVTAFFDPMRVGANDPGEVQPAWLDDVHFEPGQLRTACLTLVERQSGIVFAQEWLVKKLPTYRIPDVDELFRSVEGASTP